MDIIRAFRLNRVGVALAEPAAPESILDRLPDGVLESVDGVIVSANRAAGQILVCDPASLRGRKVSSVWTPFSPEPPVGFAPASADRFVARFTRGDGESRVAAITVTRIAAAVDGRASIVHALRDVTIEWNASESLARSEARYRHLFEGASDAIMTFDAFGRFTTVNNAGEAISGYARDELIGRFFGPLLAFDALPKAMLQFRRALAGNAGQFETVMLRKDGERRHITVNYACPERSREVICMIRDATQEKALQQQLIQSEKMAAIGQLVSGVAHEINNPLASISGFAQLLLAEGALSPSVRKSAEVIANESKRAARIVHNLLTFARQHAAEKAPTNTNAVVEAALELRAYELNVRGVEVVRDLAPDLPDTVLDVHQIQQVLLNLITNAEQAMLERDGSGNRLTVRTRRAGDRIRIVIEDTGGGIPPEKLDLIFNPFFTTKPTGQGTGLGLSISLGIVSEHGGTIRAENIAGGCRFIVELPVTLVGAVTAHARPRVSTAITPLRVLVADDEAPIREALERFLASQGHVVVAVSSGHEALWRAEGDEHFDAIILDMRMPDLSGQQIFEQWCRDRPTLSERVVFLTGDIVSPDLRTFLAGTARPYLSKPFEFADVTAALAVPHGPLARRWRESSCE